MQIDIDDLIGWLFMIMLSAIVLGMLVFVIWGIGQAFSTRDYYKDCVMKAVDEYKASADILSICRELK